MLLLLLLSMLMKMMMLLSVVAVVGSINLVAFNGVSCVVSAPAALFSGQSSLFAAVARSHRLPRTVDGQPVAP